MAPEIEAEISSCRSRQDEKPSHDSTPQHHTQNGHPWACSGRSPKRCRPLCTPGSPETVTSNLHRHALLRAHSSTTVPISGPHSPRLSRRRCPTPGLYNYITLARTAAACALAPCPREPNWQRRPPFLNIRPAHLELSGHFPVAPLERRVMMPLPKTTTWESLLGRIAGRLRDACV